MLCQLSQEREFQNLPPDHLPGSQNRPLPFGFAHGSRLTRTQRETCICPAALPTLSLTRKSLRTLSPACMTPPEMITDFFDHQSMRRAESTSSAAIQQTEERRSRWTEPWPCRRIPGTTPPRRAASSFRHRTGSLPSDGFDPPKPTEGPFCSAHALSIRETAFLCTMPLRRSGRCAERRRQKSLAGRRLCHWATMTAGAFSALLLVCPPI